MTFILVDKITHYEPGKTIEGIKHISITEPYLGASHYDKHPVYISALVGESIGQLAAWNVMDALSFTKRPVAGLADEVNIFDEVRVGETLRMKANIIQLDDEAVEYHGEAFVGSNKIVELRHAIGPMMPMEQMNDKAEVLRQFEQLMQDIDSFSLEEQTASSTSVLYPQIGNSISTNQYCCFDRITQLEQSDMCVAEKLVSRSAPYFADHFPHKPVLPLTILLACKIEFAQLYLQKFYPKNRFQLMQLRKVKMSSFVEPGMKVVTKMTAKQKQEDTIKFQFKSFVGQTRVCMCEFIFERASVPRKIRPISYIEPEMT